MRSTIKKHKDFFMPEDAPRFIGTLLIARAKPARFPGDGRYGITATKRTFRHAVMRNTAKRRMRAWLRQNEAGMSPDADYVFIARAALLDACFDKGAAQVKLALETLNAQADAGGK